MSAEAASSPGGHPPRPPAAGPDAVEPILSARSVLKQFGGLIAVDVEMLDVESGRITALIGPNGAGKTTLFNVLTGFERATRGRWSFDGRAVTGKPAHVIAARGMVRTFQLTKVLARMTVMDNMLLAAPGQRGERFAVGLVRPLWSGYEEGMRRRARDLLSRFSLDHMAGEYAATLSGGQRKLLEMARALMTAPKMLLLDEPVAGVNPALTRSILEHVKAMSEEGLTILFVEHDMDVVMDISDRVVCMAQGRVVAEGSCQQVIRDPAVIDAYLGTRHGRSGNDSSEGDDR